MDSWYYTPYYGYLRHRWNPMVEHGGRFKPWFKSVTTWGAFCGAEVPIMLNVVTRYLADASLVACVRYRWGLRPLSPPYMASPCRSYPTVLSLQHSIARGRAGRPIDGPFQRPLCIASLLPTVLDSVGNLTNHGFML